MHTTSLLSFLLPTLAFSSPLLPRQDPCGPTSYTISNYQLTSNSAGVHIVFTFQSHFPNPALVQDGAVTGATCDVFSPGGVVQNSFACSTGRDNLSFVPEDGAEFTLKHSWRCNGQEFISNTRHRLDKTTCSVDGAGTATCSSPPDDFQPENVMPIWRNE